MLQNLSGGIKLVCCVRACVGGSWNGSKLVGETSEILVVGGDHFWAPVLSWLRDRVSNGEAHT